MRAAILGLFLLGCANAHVITYGERVQRRHMVACAIVGYNEDVISPEYLCDCAKQWASDAGLGQQDLIEGLGVSSEVCQ